MIIAATSDVHSPRFFGEFVKALDRISVQPDLFLLAGDMISRGEAEEYEKVYNALFGKIKCPIVACFGNQEYQPIRDSVKKSFPDIKFLDDDAAVFEIASTSVGVVGTTGSLDTPTPWQKANVPNIEKFYQDRISTVDRFLLRLRTQVKILLMHYAPTYKTLEGENPRFYSSMASRMFEPILWNKKPTVVIHGHSHRGQKKAWVDTIPVFNVCFFLNREIVIIDTNKDLKPGIAKFV
jgi:Icc-related predicted phosphoesterase